VKSEAGHFQLLLLITPSDPEEGLRIVWMLPVATT
jgi:hypothetical protein